MLVTAAGHPLRHCVTVHSLFSRWLCAVFFWDKNTVLPPHDVWLVSKEGFDSCVTAGGDKLAEVGYTGLAKYTVTAPPGTVLYFICGYTYHCLVGLKTAVKVT